MPTISYITPEELAVIIGDLRAEFHTLLQAYVDSEEKWLTTEQATMAAKISRTTLIQSARADRPDTEQAGRITYHKKGTKSLYARSSCINYARRKQGLPALHG
jgi:hypothetical protein